MIPNKTDYFLQVEAYSVKIPITSWYNVYTKTKHTLQLFTQSRPERGLLCKAVLSGYKVWHMRLRNLCFTTTVFAKHKFKIAWFHKE